MGVEKHHLFKFFFLHLCLIIPVVTASFLTANMVAEEAKEIEKQAAQYQLNDTLTGFVSDYQDYYDESILLACRQELKKDHISGDPVETAKGINTLKLKQYFDNRIKDVFVYYDTGYVYSAAGVSRNSVHFDSVLNCTEESVDRGIAAMEGQENALLFLYESDTAGYLMYSYPVRQANKEYASVNFVVPFEQVKRKFSQLQEGQLYVLTSSDGSMLRLYRDMSGKMSVLTEEETARILQNGRYVELKEVLEDLGFTACLYYEEMSMSLGNGLNQMKTVNLILITAGIVLSAAVSWRFSRKRVNEIMNLESVARGDMAQKFSDKSVYNRLQNIIITNLSESKELEVKATRYAALLRDKAAQLIFLGLSKNTEDIALAFKELGFSGCPGCFFVGVLSTKGRLEEPQLPPVLKECLLMHVIHESRNMVAFLYELPTDDFNQLQRRQLAEEIRSYLHRQNIRQVRIGMSQVYTNSLMIDYAYSEALSVLEHVIGGKIQDFCGCWENAVQDISFILPENDDLSAFAESLKQQDFEEAKKWYYHIMEGVSGECTEENRVYIRYRILQCLVEYLQEESTVEKAALLKECLNISVKEEKEFSRSVMHILKHCLVKREKDNFTRMLDYIENNYCRSDLVYDEVAAAGGVSKTYVSKLFRAKLGVSYIEYLTSVRMDRACTLLRTTDASINDIVKMVGYENASSFRRCFKEKYGISAAEYRKKERMLREEQEERL